MGKTVRLLRSLLVLCLLAALACADPREERENVQWIEELRQYAQTQSEPVRQALEQIIQDGLAMGTLNQHKQHDTLQAALSKVDRARVEPDGAVERERLDSPVSNFGEVVQGKVYRGGQPSPQALRWLQQQGVGTIILLREPGVEETNYPGYSREAYLRDIKSLGMSCVELVIRDHTVPNPDQIQKFLQTLGESQAPVFFHCSAGVGRTGILAGLYERTLGIDSSEALRHSKRFQLNPALVPDHALQASLLANYPLPGHQDTLDLPWGAPGLNPLKVALASGRGWTLPASARVRFDLANPEPALKRLAEVLRGREVVCLEFTSPEQIDILASLARVVPVAQKMGSLKLSDRLTLADLDRARHLLGPVPFEVVVSADRMAAPEPLAAQLQGHAEIVDFGVNPPEAIVQLLSQKGLACHLRPDIKLPLAHYDAIGIGYFSEAP